MEPLCNCLRNLLVIEINFDETKTDAKLELVSKVLSELMDVLERKNIVSQSIFFVLKLTFYKKFRIK
jgi:hypothetical protein